MVGCAWNSVGNFEEEQAERQQRDRADMDLLRRDAVEDGEKQRWREHARQNDVHHVELVATTDCHRERDVREQFGRTTVEVKFVTLHARANDVPFAVRFVADAYRSIEQIRNSNVSV